MSTAPTPADTASSRDNEHPFRYNAQIADQIESRWQTFWAEHDTFVTPNPGDTGFDGSKPKYFCMDMFPYPSGAGLHVGHPEGYTATDIICRFKRMTGHNVLHPMGWDAFGLPAEQYAIATGVHPAITTRKAIDNFRRQLQRFGFSYDWSREFATIDPDYYKWTQWIWLKAYDSWFDTDANKARPISALIDAFRNGTRTIEVDPDAPRGLIHAEDAGTTYTNWDALDDSTQRRILASYRLAYLAEQTVNWCPKLGTALANEEVIDGRSERGDFPVLRKPLRQWMFRITAFADRLLEDLDSLKWPESTQSMQKQWIGRSEGAEVEFPLDGRDGALRVFTTRPDTIFGATFMVVAPEHPVVADIIANPTSETDVDALKAYVEEASNRTDVERMADSESKTGRFTGAYAVNPASNERIQIWVADYVLMGYGHGAIMAVPAHDERDFEFATKFELPIIDVVYSPALEKVRAFAHFAAEKNIDAAAIDDQQLIDFVALAMNQRRFTDEQLWKGIQRRDKEIFPEGQTHADGERRGMIAHIWRDALKDLLKDGIVSLLEDARHGRLIQRFGSAASEPGVAVNSANDEISIDGLHMDDAKSAIMDWFESKGIGNRKINFKLRDWLFSRQRYWGEPFPIVFDEAGNHYPVAPTQLPVELPDMADYKPVESDDPTPLLGKATDWVNTTAGEAGVDPALLPPDTPVHRETNTMPGWAGSCWYYLRYCDAKNDDALASRTAERYWMLSRKGDDATPDADETYNADVHHIGGVDLYIGGAEHAVLHLLYARFWHKILFDLGDVSTPEPFGKLYHQGLITSFAFVNDEKRLVPVDEVEERGEDNFIEIETGKPVTRTVAKMSKSLKNVINPDDVIADYGADTFRLYEMYMGPLDASKPWNTRDIVGPYRFLQRCWRLCVDEATGAPIIRDGDANPDIEKQLHRTIAKVEQDIDRLALNTGIAALIEFVNAATGNALTRDQAMRFAFILSPFAPHMAEEIASKLGHEGSIAHAAWPTYDEAMLVEDEVEIAVQVLGKVRAKITVPADADKNALEAAALADERIVELIEGKTVRKVIVVPGKLVNIVAN